MLVETIVTGGIITIFVFYLSIPIQCCIRVICLVVTI